MAQDQCSTTISSLRSLLKVFEDESNQCILVSGEAGTGKTRLLKDFWEHLRTKNSSLRIAITAPTGVAAVNVGGVTLHSFVGMGLMRGSLEDIMKKGLSQRCRDAFRKTDVLIVDEISMVDPSMLGKIEAMARLARLGRALYKKKGAVLFGGMRLVMFGDFMQLPPIQRSCAKVKYVFQTGVWKAMDVVRLRLHKVHRQNDLEFLQFLRQLRQGELTQQGMATLESRVVEDELSPDVKRTRLCSHRNTVETYNSRRLEELDSPKICLAGFFEVRKVRRSGAPNLAMGEPNATASKGAPDDDLVAAGVRTAQTERILKVVRLSAESRFPVSADLEIKKGAQVMMRNNQYLKLGICNGSIGVVLEATSVCITVDFAGTHIGLRRYPFFHRYSREYDVVLRQFPLMLAWAMTIHKSQGMTLSAAHLDADCFEYGQLYTAFSRVRSLKDLSLSRPVTDKSLLVNEDALEFERLPCTPI